MIVNIIIDSIDVMYTYSREIREKNRFDMTIHQNLEICISDFWLISKDQ